MLPEFTRQLSILTINLLLKNNKHAKACLSFHRAHVTSVGIPPNRNLNGTKRQMHHSE
jgi:hypothetical protein